ncbi:methionine ABC transporter ATP-binding protein [Bacillus coahuilensis p1.1.43]|uniref:Methionine ABC transporter ATP-binding protein n=1 Tax=Bacillus coahuilensis p1.1.43 TaxID=1150625 RepID=A0A147K5Q9_9BACI|nr:methionine ABC transporter ATP-binding protein [Bacillus coahuilensis]KUP05147.1 methionine ABC transporter ATP-binding protein [Bacillus coahuilensis p1.1.43]
MITLSHVKKIFQSKSGPLTAVNDVNLSIPEGEIFGVIGYSGAGKSTLIRMLNGLEVPSDGTVDVNGQIVSKIKGKQLRQARQDISMIFQHFNLLWSRTVRDNIAFPLEIAGVEKEERYKRVNELIKLVGLEGREEAYPSQLSGGQKQRVGIARALANQPKVLLCDEATSALDPETTDSILDLLVDINKKFGLTIVLITHEMHVIKKICHRVAVMESGQVVELGEVLDVFRNPKEPITKRFVQQLTEGEETEASIHQVLESYPNGTILRVSFLEDATEQPYISRFIRKFEIDVNILQGNITHTQKGAIGTLLIHIEGSEEETTKSIAYLQEQSLGVEVIQHD